MDEMPLRLYTDIREAMQNEEAVEATDGPYIICVTAVDEWEMVIETADFNVTEPGYLLTAGYASVAHFHEYFKTIDALAQYLAAGSVYGIKEFIWRSAFED